MKNKDWFRPRSYLHFDSRIGLSSKSQVETLVTNPTTVSQHAFLPFLRYEKEKPKVEFNEETKKREFKMGTRLICYASHLDAHIYSYYSIQLNKIYEDKLNQMGLSENVIAFRKIYCQQSGKSKSNIHFANDAFNEIIKAGECKVFAFDVKKFFDTLNAKELKRQWASVLGTTGLPEDHYAIFRSVTKYSVVERDRVLSHFGISKDTKRQMHLRRICSLEKFDQIVRKNEMIKVLKKGIPQGSPISATLANIYMLNFDYVVSEKVKSIGGKYYRYCDDIMIIIPPNEAFDVAEFVQSELKKVQLDLNTSKTETSIFYRNGESLCCIEPIQYLGFVFDGKVKSLRPASISFYRRDVKKSINRVVAAKIRIDKRCNDLGKPKKPIHVKGIIRSYSHLGQRTFITYGQRAQEIMGSEAIRLQLAGLHRFLENEIKWARSIV